MRKKNRIADDILTRNAVRNHFRQKKVYLFRVARVFRSRPMKRLLRAEGRSHLLLTLYVVF